MPTRRFWLLTLLAFPAAGIAAVAAIGAIRGPIPVAVLGLLAIEASVFAKDPTLRRMTPRQRTVWIVVGCTATAVIVALGVSVIFFALLFEQCSEGC